MSRALIFPGQGSQTVGMGRALVETFAPARRVFEEIDDTLSQRLSRIMWEGPESELVLTENAQPAIMALSLAIVRVLEAEAGLDIARHFRLVAGHSLGEYSALCASGAFTLADTARLLRIRGRAMQDAVPVGEGGMAVLLGIEIAAAEEACEEARTVGLVVVANDNAPGQIVVSGEKAAVDKAGEIAKSKGARRFLPLSVSAPFHSPMLAPAADIMREALMEVTIRPLVVPLVSNVTAAEISEPESIRNLLVEQVTSRVRWRESVATFRERGVGMTVEAGGNKVLTGMVRRIDPELETVSLDNAKDIETFARTL
jgi:[acyl-carrier-protein] S-malonyltransferase